MSARIHDLLEIDARHFLDAHGGAPRWVGESLRRAPFVVVRRGTIAAEEIPVGVRGMYRHERWAGICHPLWVRRVVTPMQLASPSSRAEAIPALRSLAFLKRSYWKEFDGLWGPVGSAGFELATGQHVLRQESDLDVVIYADRRLSLREAQSLRDCAAQLPAAVDIRVETPACGFSLLEYARGDSAAILLRTASGVLLGADPWNVGAGVRSRAL
jgi:phosphoribosyl-dephospho-CoA transferase